MSIASRPLSTTIFFTLVGAIVGLSALACGSDDSSESITCCLNEAFYDCNDSDELATCRLDGTNECRRDSSRDSECEDD